VAETGSMVENLRGRTGWSTRVREGGLGKLLIWRAWKSQFRGWFTLQSVNQQGGNARDDRGTWRMG
jgi:hypothetical protein